MNLSAKIAALVNETSFVVNVGSLNGVHVGDEVVVWEDREISDPDSGDPLGTIRVTLAVARTREVQEKLSVAETLYRKQAMSALVFSELPRPVRRFTTGPAIDADQVKVKIGQVVTVVTQDAQ